MKKIIAVILIAATVLAMSGCAIIPAKNEQNQLNPVIDLGDTSPATPSVPEFTMVPGTVVMSETAAPTTTEPTTTEPTTTEPTTTEPTTTEPTTTEPTTTEPTTTEPTTTEPTTTEPTTTVPTTTEPTTTVPTTTAPTTVPPTETFTAQTTVSDNGHETIIDSKAPQTPAQIVSYSNKVLNKVKTDKAGFKKRVVMTVSGEVTGMPERTLERLNGDKTATVKKGSSSVTSFPASGKSWSSKLKSSDVKTAEIGIDGGKYNITLTLGKEKNPAADSTSSYGRCMSVIDGDGVDSMLPGLGIEDIDLTYSGGKIKLVVDSSNGRLISCEYYVSVDAKAETSAYGTVTVKDIVCTETITDFVY